MELYDEYLDYDDGEPRAIRGLINWYYKRPWRAWKRKPWRKFSDSRKGDKQRAHRAFRRSIRQAQRGGNARVDSLTKRDLW